MEDTIPTGVEIKKEAFRSTEALEEVNNLKYVIKVGEYAFAESNIRNVEIGINAKYEEGVFFQSKIEEVTIGEGAVIAAESNVIKDVEPWTIVGGNPAKYIKDRILK